MLCEKFYKKTKKSSDVKKRKEKQWKAIDDKKNEKR